MPRLDIDGSFLTAGELSAFEVLQVGEIYERLMRRPDKDNDISGY